MIEAVVGVTARSLQKPTKWKSIMTSTRHLTRSYHVLQSNASSYSIVKRFVSAQAKSPNFNTTRLTHFIRNYMTLNERNRLSLLWSWKEGLRVISRWFRVHLQIPTSRTAIRLLIGLRYHVNLTLYSHTSSVSQLDSPIGCFRSDCYRRI